GVGGLLFFRGALHFTYILTSRYFMSSHRFECTAAMDAVSAGSRVSGAGCVCEPSQCSVTAMADRADGSAWWTPRFLGGSLARLACETGRNNRGVLVGASLSTAALALAAAAAARSPIAPARLGLLALTAFLAGSARMESLLTCVAGAAVLLMIGGARGMRPR